MCFGGFDGLLLFKLVTVFFFCIFNKSVFSYLKVLHDALARQSQRCPRDCSDGLVVASLEETRWGVLWLALAGWPTVGGGITQGDAVGCSHVLTACMQATSLKGAQGVLWQVAMSPRARCFFFPTPVHTASASGGDRAVLDQ
jgi:ribosomal protein S27AE